MAVKDDVLCNVLFNLETQVSLALITGDEKDIYTLIKQLNILRDRCNEKLYEMIFEEAYE